MKKTILIPVIASFLLSASAFAAPKKKKPQVKPAAPAAETTYSPAPVSSEPRRSGGSTLNWTPSASFGLGSIDSRFHLGVTGKVETTVDFEGNSIKVGGRTGFLLSLDDVSGWVIPMTATAGYEFAPQGGLTPYFNVDLGISIDHVSVATFSDTRVKFAGFVTPGVRFQGNYFAEMPFGTLAGGFMILPSVGMRF